MRAYVERVHRGGCRWDMMPSLPGWGKRFAGCFGSRFSGDVPFSLAPGLVLPCPEPRSARAFGGDLPVAREVFVAK